MAGFRGSVSTVALIVAAFALPTSPARAETVPTESAFLVERDVIYVQGARLAYDENETSSATRTPAALEDIPQSVIVITRDVIQDQAMTGMGDLVRYVPGVTMGQGEGHRDAPVFRGNITTSDFFVDGVRDDLQYLRDLYNVDRVDILKGPSSFVFGRGAGGGALNRISKTADGVRQLALDAAISTEGARRFAADLGGSLSDGLSARFNAVAEDSSSYRDDVDIHRLGLAPTVSLEIEDGVRIDLFAEYFSDERTVDRGIPSEAGRPWSRSASAFFGNPALSRSDIEVATLRVTATRDLSEELSFRGVVSYGDYSKFYSNVFPGGAVDAASGLVRISSYTAGTDRRNLLAQADLTYRASLAGTEHLMLFGLEAGRQESWNSRVNGASETFSLTDRGRSFAPSFALPAAIDNANQLDLVAFLVQDQITISEGLQAVVGLRWDRFDLVFDDRRPPSSDYDRLDTFLSPKAGVIWEAAPGVSIYGGWSRAYLPQAGEQFSTLTTVSAGLEPETFENSEIGLKWRANDRLLLSAALYRLDRTNTIAPGAVAGTVVQTGSQRSEGLEIALQGELAEGWNIVGAAALQEASITSTTSAAPAGRTAPLAADVSFSLWNRFSLTDRLDAAVGMIRQGRQYASITNAVELPAYTRIDAALFYALNDDMHLQLNIENVSDEAYWFTAHNDNNITPGSPTSARLTLSSLF